MKYVILVGDGMGDYPLDELGGKTILQHAHTPHMDALAAVGRMGLAATVPEGLEPGSDVANMSILGYDPAVHNCGRGPLEAASMGVAPAPNELAFRLNFVTLEITPTGRVFMRDHSAGHLTSEEGAELIEYLKQHLDLSQGQRLYPGVSYRHLLLWPNLAEGLPTVPPHDWRDREVTDYFTTDNPDFKQLLDLVQASWPLLSDHPVNQKRIQKGLRPANSVWPWGQGRPPAMPSYKERFGVEGVVVSAVDLIKGLGVFAGLTPLEVPGVTGLVDTNYEGKVQAAMNALKDQDFALIHVEAPDEAGHQGDIGQKVTAVERFDQRVVGPVRQALGDLGDHRLLVLCDHFTPITLKTHCAEPVPFILYPDDSPAGRPYSEAAARETGVVVDAGHRLINLLFAREG